MHCSGTKGQKKRDEEKMAVVDGGERAASPCPSVQSERRGWERKECSDLSVTGQVKLPITVCVCVCFGVPAFLSLSGSSVLALSVRS